MSKNESDVYGKYSNFSYFENKFSNKTLKKYISFFKKLTGLTSGLEVVKLDENQEVVVSGFESASEATTIMENSKTASTAESGGASRRDATGLIALRPDTGQELWRQSLKALPRKHDCNLVDVNGDGLQDCLVVGDGGLLTAIEPRTGMLIYCGEMVQRS